MWGKDKAIPYMREGTEQRTPDNNPIWNQSGSD